MTLAALIRPAPRAEIPAIKGDASQPLQGRCTLGLRCLVASNAIRRIEGVLIPCAFPRMVTPVGARPWAKVPGAKVAG